MSQSVTVIGGLSGSSLSGLVTVKLDTNVNVSVAGGLQSLLGMAGQSGSVTAGSLAVTNVNAISGSINGNTYSVPSGTSNGGILEFTDTNSNGSVVGGAGASGTGYITANGNNTLNTIIVEAPGSFRLLDNSLPNALVLLDKQSQVRFNAGFSTGNGTVVAGGSGQTVVTSGAWSINGSTDGGDVMNSQGGNATINTFGNGSANGDAGSNTNAPSNTVGIFGGNATVNSSGTADFIEVFLNASPATAVVSVMGSANVLDGGGNVTVYAAAGSNNVRAFFQVAGDLDFINNSTVQAFVTGEAPNSKGGSATAFGGIGGGSYTGGTDGNNSLIGGFTSGQITTGGAGLVTLVGSGNGNYLEAGGSVTGAGGNLLVASNNNGTATIVAAASTGNNTIDARGAGQVSVLSSGTGTQTFYLGTGGVNDTITGSTVSGATNAYYLTGSNGFGTDVINNFRIAKDTFSISGGATIANATTVSAGSFVTLSDNSQILLVGVSLTQSQIASIKGGTSF